MSLCRSPSVPVVLRKWRPSLGLSLAVMLSCVLLLPLMSLFFFRIYENQLIRQTESDLIGQSAALAATLGRDIEASPITDDMLGAKVESPPPDADSGMYRPILPSLDLAGDDLRPSRPEASPPETPANPLFLAIGKRLDPVLTQTQKVSLAGFRILDPHGVVIAGREEVDLSLAGVEEVKAALRGDFRAVLRLRVSRHEPPPLYSLSRGTGVRIFTAFPVVARGRVAGVIYASRTPMNIMKHLYENRHKVGLAALFILGLTCGVGLLFHRTLAGPIRELVARTRAIARGDREAIKPLSRHGTREIASLTQGFLDMAGSLAARSDYIATFAAHVSHELKSPLTSIAGAAELLQGDQEGGPEKMDDAARQRFLCNIITDTQRLTLVVNRLRELAQAETQPISGSASLAGILSGLRSGFPGLQFSTSGEIAQHMAISAENLRIVLSHLADNSVRHGADTLAISVRRESETVYLSVSDNGSGISPNNRTRIFDNFFTTRRTQGGTGMGLCIVRAMLTAHGATIELAPGERGASFLLGLPAGNPQSDA